MEILDSRLHGNDKKTKNDKKRDTGFPIKLGMTKGKYWIPNQVGNDKKNMNDKKI